ncbi:sodium/calcium exchanger 1 isoform X1 [Ixodes scapularis]
MAARAGGGTVVAPPGVLTFQEFPLYIIDNESYEKDAVLYIELGDPKLEEDDPYYIQEKLAYEKSDLLREHGVNEVPEVELTEAQKIALMGRPRIGDQNRCTIRIKESKEFKNTVDKLFQKANISLMIGTSSWKEQFKEALTVVADEDEEGAEDGQDVVVKMPSCSDYVMHFFTIFWKVLFAFVPPTDYWGGWACFVTSILLIGVLTAFVGDLASHFGCTIGLKDSVTAISLVALGTSIPEDHTIVLDSAISGVESKKLTDEDEEGAEDGQDVVVKMPSCSDYVMHFFTIFWKVLFAFVPPTDYWGGWACFVTSILLIGVLTAFVGDLASHFGCTIGLKDSVTAISLVALGTSIPDTFASKVAAMNDKYADSSIGNVTGSNAVNVFLGIGVAWSLAAFVHWGRGTTFRVLPGNLAFSVTIFCVCALIACVLLLARRNKRVGGELGGPMRFKLPTTIILTGLWIFYVTMSALEAYGVIQGF